MQQQTVTADFRTLAIDKLRESQTNPRRSFDPSKLEELANSIRAQGVLVPLIVRNVGADQFEVVAGARRFRAAQAAQLFAVPVRIVDLTDDEALTLQLVENAQREDVHPLEEAFAYRALLDRTEPIYDVESIALKVGKSMGHIYGRLRYVDLIEPVAQAFLENHLTAGHALLIARLPQSQQGRALEAAFRSHWGSTEKQAAVPVRELAQWIRQNLMLRLEEAIFDREDETLLPESGSCVQCPKRTGFNTALFDDFRNDDQCLDSACYQAKVSLWLKRQTEQNPSLVQISENYRPHRDESIIPRNQYVEIKPVEKEEPGNLNQVVCESAVTGIVVEGNHVGKIVQICADPECHVHHVPQHPALEERDEEFERAAEERQTNLAENGKLLESVLAKVPAILGRADYELIVSAWLDSLDYEDFECLCERHSISGEGNENDPRDLFRQSVSQLTDAEVSRFLMELALLPSGYSSHKLDQNDRLLAAFRLYHRPRKRIALEVRGKRKQKAKRRPEPSAKKKMMAKGAA